MSESDEKLSGRAARAVRQAWEQRPDESGIAFEAFKTYRDLGLERTLSEAYRRKTGRRKAKQASGQWNDYYRRFDWPARAEAFDRYVAAIEAREEDKAFAEQRRKWIDRRGEIQDFAWNLAGALRKRAEEILALPVTRLVETEEVEEVERETGRVLVTKIVKVTEPLKVTLADATRAAEMSDKLARLAANMATERIIVRSAAAETAQTIEDARLAFREARDLFRDSEPLQVTAANIAAAYGLEAALLLEGYDDAAPLASQANN